MKNQVCPFVMLSMTNSDLEVSHFDEATHLYLLVLLNESEHCAKYFNTKVNDISTVYLSHPVYF